MVNGSFTRPSDEEQVTIRAMQSAVAHEIGHTYELGDEYNRMNGAFQCNINPPPASYVGRQWGAILGGCNNYRCASSNAVAWPGPATGSTVLGVQDHPFEVSGRGPLGDMLSFMGSGGAPQSDYWVTPSIYNHLFGPKIPVITYIFCSIHRYQLFFDFINHAIQFVGIFTRDADSYWVC